MLTLEQFHNEFIAKTQGWQWEVEGFLDSQNFVHPIDSDTKVISTVFERLASPVIRSICRDAGYKVEIANQTTYPDFTLSTVTHQGQVHRIAVDIKTTYESRLMAFTLGGYNSFLRNDTKNILYPYSTYSEHWIIGFIYRQAERFAEYDLESMPTRGDIPCSYSNVSFFIREKHAISGLRAGSGNTKNIGSFRAANRHEFSTTMGPFMMFRRAKDACDHYWRNYELYCPQISNPDQLINHVDFQIFR